MVNVKVRTAVAGIDNIIRSASIVGESTFIHTADSGSLVLPWKAETPTLLFAALSNPAYRGLRKGWHFLLSELTKAEYGFEIDTPSDDAVVVTLVRHNSRARLVLSKTLPTPPYEASEFRSVDNFPFFAKAPGRSLAPLPSVVFLARALDIVTASAAGDRERLLDLPPLMIVSGITDKCNQRCPFCFRHTDPSYTLSDGTVFTRDNILTFAAEVAESGTAGIRLCGEGEDTLHKDYLDFLLLLRAAGVNILQITNGTTAAHFAPVFARCVDVLRVSVNGWNNTHYARKHGVGTDCGFEQVVDGIASVVQERNLLHRARLPFICISSVLYPEDTLSYSITDLRELVGCTGADHVILKQDRECSRTSSLSLVRFGSNATISTPERHILHGDSSQVVREFEALCAMHLPGMLRPASAYAKPEMPDWITKLQLGCILRYLRLEVERFHVYNCSVVHDYYGDARETIYSTWRSLHRERGITADVVRVPLICSDCGWQDVFTFMNAALDKHIRDQCGGRERIIPQT